MKKGSVKLSVMYPSGEGKHFDIDYYVNKHFSYVVSLLGDAIVGVSIEKGIGGEGKGQAPFEAVGNLYFESMESFQNSFGAHVKEIRADLENFTNIEPVVQIGEVMV